jgi:hypothetical protein
MGNYEKKKTRTVFSLRGPPPPPEGPVFVRVFGFPVGPSMVDASAFL